MNIIRETRANLKLTQAELGEKLGTSSTTIARWERGEIKPEHPEMLELALFGLTIKMRDVKTRDKIRKIETESRAELAEAESVLNRINA